MSDLRTELDVVLRAVEPGPPPVEATMRRGQRLRSRRRLTALTGSLAVAVLAAAAYPVLGHLGRTTPVTPSAAAGSAGITETPGFSAGVIATGTDGGERWRLSVGGSATRGLCYTGTAGGESLGTACDLIAQPAGTPSGWHALGNGSYKAVITGVAPDVQYLVVTEKNSQGLSVLKLIPVSAGVSGQRFIGLVATKGVSLVSATAYLTDGQEEAITQSVPPGWTRSGGDSPPVADGDLGQLNADGQSWIVDATEGSFGTCVNLATVGQVGHLGQVQSSSCTTVAPMTALAAIGAFELSDDSPPIVYGSAPPAAATLTVTLTNGKSFPVAVVTVGNENLWSFGLDPGQTVKMLTAFSASGATLGTGGLP